MRIECGKWFTAEYVISYFLPCRLFYHSALPDGRTTTMRGDSSSRNRDKNSGFSPIVRVAVPVPSCESAIGKVGGGSCLQRESESRGEASRAHRCRSLSCVRQVANVKTKKFGMNEDVDQCRLGSAPNSKLSTVRIEVFRANGRCTARLTEGGRVEPVLHKNI